MNESSRGRLAGVAIVAVTVLALLPIVGMVSLSFRPTAAHLSPRLLLPPIDPRIDNWRDLAAEPGLLRSIVNSTILAAATVASNLLLAGLAGWGLARAEGGTRAIWRATLLLALAIPPQATVVPLFLCFERWNLLDSWAALFLPGVLMPANIFLAAAAVDRIPGSLLDAAQVDGASPARILRHVVLPMLSPTLAVVGIQSFLSSWTAFLFPFLMTNSSDRRTLPVLLALLGGRDQVRWGVVMAGSVVATLPVVAVFWLARRQLSEAVTAGARKG
jgi:ABC-type glycerol-3-phosphate transport system permease component